VKVAPFVAQLPGGGPAVACELFAKSWGGMTFFESSSRLYIAYWWSMIFSEDRRVLD
jgi:hypothetical protein